MEQQETPKSAEVLSRPQNVWETLTPAQQKAVLQTMVWICRQLAEQWMAEVGDEPVVE